MISGCLLQQMLFNRLQICRSLFQQHHGGFDGDTSVQENEFSVLIENSVMHLQIDSWKWLRLHTLQDQGYVKFHTKGMAISSVLAQPFHSKVWMRASPRCSTRSTYLATAARYNRGHLASASDFFVLQYVHFHVDLKKSSFKSLWRISRSFSFRKFSAPEAQS